jgi:hypothetical protein
MCTVSFVPRKNGYLLAMNRDEKRTRPPGLAPTRFMIGGREIICPTEPGGGTWIALNDAQTTFALINWYAVKAAVKTNAVSRGVVVKSLAAEVSPAASSIILAGLPLQQINPFRLIGFFGAQREIREWRWDLKILTCGRPSWDAQPWISSGFDEPQAQRARSSTFRVALRRQDAGSLRWLRRLHSSHAPFCGPFSICMHRAEAATVSYTEVAVFNRRATMSHCNQAPCERGLMPLFCGEVPRL